MLCYKETHTTHELIYMLFEDELRLITNSTTHSRVNTGREKRNCTCSLSRGGKTESQNAQGRLMEAGED